MQILLSASPWQIHNTSNQAIDIADTEVTHIEPGSIIENLSYIKPAFGASSVL
jgi:hypothetical protein